MSVRRLTSTGEDEWAALRKQMRELVSTQLGYPPELFTLDIVAAGDGSGKATVRASVDCFARQDLYPLLINGSTHDHCQYPF